MTLQGKVNLLDPFTHTEQDYYKITKFDFIRETLTERQKIRIDETYCTLVTVSGKYLEKKNLKKILKKIDEIRRIIRIKINPTLSIQQVFNYYIYRFFFTKVS